MADKKAWVMMMMVVKAIAVYASLLHLLFFIPSIEAGVTQENIYSSGCTDDEMILQCPKDHRIAIKRLFFGVKKSWDCQSQDSRLPSQCCHASHTDCLINDDSKYPTLNTHCSGYQRCKIKVQKVPATGHCSNAVTSDYMTVIYDCVPEVDIVNFCSDTVKKGRTLYLANEEYPSSVTDRKDSCTCMARNRGGGQGVNIHSIDVLLAWAQHGGRSCSKELLIKDEKGYRWNIQCGHIGFYGFRTIYTRPVQNVTLMLKSSATKGSAFVWLQVRATEDEDQVEVICGEPLRQLLLRSRQKVESRHRDREDSNRTTTPIDRGRIRNATYPLAAHTESLSSSLAAIIGGIVGAGFILISIVIIALAFHCRRVQLARQKRTQTLNLYPAVTKGETTGLSSYCHYNDYDDDHYSSISRSPLKMSSLTESDIATNHARTNGFVTLATAQSHANSDSYYEDLAPSTLPRSSSSPNDGLPTADPGYPPPSDLSPLMYSPRPSGLLLDVNVHDGHKTLPHNRHHHHRSLLGASKSPFCKRSKSVTFSQPVAMVTPLPSGSEESVGNDDVEKVSPTGSVEDGDYDNLNKMIIPDSPMSPSQIHTIDCTPMVSDSLHDCLSQLGQPSYPQQQPDGDMLTCSLSSFRSHEMQCSGLTDYDDEGFPLPPPPLPIVVNGDVYAVVQKKPVPLPPFKPKKPNVYETGV